MLKFSQNIRKGDGIMERQEPHLAMEILHSMSKKNKCLAVALIVSLMVNIAMLVVVFIKM